MNLFYIVDDEDTFFSSIYAYRLQFSFRLVFVWACIAMISQCRSLFVKIRRFCML